MLLVLRSGHRACTGISSHAGDRTTAPGVPEEALCTGAQPRGRTLGSAAQRGFLQGWKCCVWAVPGSSPYTRVAMGHWSMMSTPEN